MKKTAYLLCIVALLCLGGCKDNGKPAVTLPGGDRDDHECIGSAGYTWSNVLERCIRIFEDGEQLLPVEKPENETAILAAYAVFSADSLQAELFLPKVKKPAVLKRRDLPSGGYAWNAEDDDTYNLRKDTDGVWVIEKRGKVLYRASRD